MEVHRNYHQALLEGFRSIKTDTLQYYTHIVKWLFHSSFLPQARHVCWVSRSEQHTLKLYQLGARLLQARHGLLFVRRRLVFMQNSWKQCQKKRLRPNNTGLCRIFKSLAKLHDAQNWIRHVLNGDICHFLIHYQPNVFL